MDPKLVQRPLSTELRAPVVAHERHERVLGEAARFQLLDDLPEEHFKVRDLVVIGCEILAHELRVGIVGWQPELCRIVQLRALGAEWTMRVVGAKLEEKRFTFRVSAQELLELTEGCGVFPRSFDVIQAVWESCEAVFCDDFL